MPAKKRVEPPAEPAGTPAADETPEASVDGSAEEERPLNRAERRARGKTTTKAQPSFRGKVVGGHGPAHTQRMWSNRRSGG